MSRAATGLARPHPVPVGLNDTEAELLTRESIAYRKSKAELLRSAYFSNDWAVRLKKLQHEQKYINHPDLKKYR